MSDWTVWLKLGDKTIHIRRIGIILYCTYGTVSSDEDHHPSNTCQKSECRARESNMVVFDHLIIDGTHR